MSDYARVTAAMAADFNERWQEMCAALPNGGVFAATWDPSAGVDAFLASLDPSGNWLGLLDYDAGPILGADGTLILRDLRGCSRCLRPGDSWVVDLRKVPVS